MKVFACIRVGLFVTLLGFYQPFQTSALADTLPPLELSHLLGEVHRIHPELKACQQEVLQLESRRTEAGLAENPRLEVSGEDFLGNAAFSDQNYMQFTLSASQNIPLGNRLGLQQDVLRLQSEAQQSLCLARQRQLDLEIARHYLEVLLAQQRREQLQQMQALATQLLDQIEILIAQGKLTALERALPAAELERLLLEREQTEAELSQHRQLLFSYLPARPEVHRTLASLHTPDTSTQLQQKWLAQHPQRRYQQLLLEQARLELALQQARTLPDLTLGGGWRWHPQSREHGLNLALSVPLQIFNHNQYGLQAAQAQILQREQELRHLVEHQQRELQHLLVRLEQARQREQAFQKRMLPLSQIYLEKIRQGLDAGKFTFVSVLQALQQLLRLEQEALNMRQERARLELEVAGWRGTF